MSSCFWMNLPLLIFSNAARFSEHPLLLVSSFPNAPPSAELPSPSRYKNSMKMQNSGCFYSCIFLTTGITIISPSGPAFIMKDTEDLLPFTAQVETNHSRKQGQGMAVPAMPVEESRSCGYENCSLRQEMYYFILPLCNSYTELLGYVYINTI